MGKAAGIVIAPTPDRLPAVCSEIVQVSESGEATVLRPRLGRATQQVRLSGVTAEDARSAALGLARFDDPELHVAGAGLPDVVRLGALVGVDRWTAEVVARRWDSAERAMTRLAAVIGTDEDGPFELDFDRHGPHGLIGGTTGSGKSELLKTIVASLAATYPPEQLTFGLFDFKGGATFTDFAAMPHTVGLASDLDVNLAKRALRCLRAELLRRERVFDQAGVANLAEFNERRARGDSLAVHAEALPRLIVIIDEFAAMAKELSEEIGAIADLTARGRSLGVHLLLATQKPSTAVTAEIRTNTRLRISLKVEDGQDSVDVVGIPDAAGINQKGRGYFRVGQSEVLPIQSGLSTAPVDEGAASLVVVAPFAFEPFPAIGTTARPSGAETELAALVRAVGDAFARRGAARPRRPWPDPLPDTLGIDELGAVPVASFRSPDDIYFALGDDPDRQTRYPVGWPMRSGNLLLYGVVGSGTTTALATIALAFAEGGSPQQHHLYVLDFGSGDLAALERLPHCAAVIRATDRDRQIRLLRRLERELHRRRSGESEDLGETPTVLLVVDKLEGFHSAFDDGRGSAFWEQFVRLYADGPEAGIYTAGSVGRVGGVPPVLSTATPNKVMFRLADMADYGAVGLTRASLPTFVPGRAVLASGVMAIQVAQPQPSLDAALDAVVDARAEAWPPGSGPESLVTLGEVIPLAELGGPSTIGLDRWVLTIGRRDHDLRPATLTLYEGEHALVGGPARSGRSTALLSIAAAMKAVRPDGRVLAVASRRSPLFDAKVVERCASTPDELAEVCNIALMVDRPMLVLIDDAELVDDTDGRIAALLATAQTQVHVIAAGKSDLLRSMYGHWTQTVRRSRTGLLLQPALERDGDLLGARLPYQIHVPMPAGRGFLVCGSDVDLVQTALAEGAPPVGTG